MKYIKVIFEGKLFGPIHSPNLTALDLFSIVGADPNMYALIDLNDQVVSNQDQVLSPGIYEISKVKHSLYLNTAQHRVQIREIKQIHSNELIKKNLKRIISECKQVSKGYRFNKDKYRPIILASLQELRSIDAVLSLEERLNVDLLHVCRNLIVEYEDILTQKSPFYSRVRQPIENKQTNVTELVRFQPTTKSQERHVKINYIKSLIETDASTTKDWIDVLGITMNAEAMRHGGLQGTSRCHGKFNLFDVESASRRIKRDFRIN